MIDYIEFREELESLINRHSMENGSDTPDFILANYLAGCLVAYDNALRARDKWYNFIPWSSGVTEESPKPKEEKNNA